MKAPAALALVLIAVLVAASHATETPRYAVEVSVEGYEIRLYDPSLWICTHADDEGMSDAGKRNFRTLFSYIRGANEKHETMDMTAPVIGWRKDSGGFDNCFYLAASRYKSTKAVPAPTNPEKVYIREVPAARVAVRSFGGWATEGSWDDQASELLEALGRDRVAVPSPKTVLAQYDPPFKFWFRHNEVWAVLSTADPAPSSSS
eukprot:tig00000806_g4364.t1